MMKMNLNQTKVSTGIETRSTGMASEGLSIITYIAKKGKNFELENLSPEVLFKLIVNVILIFCFPLSLKVYEINQINKLEKIKKQKEELLGAKNQQLSELSQELQLYGYIQEQAEEYRAKKAFLKEIARKRIIIAKKMDLIQDRIPKTVWLKRLQLELLEENMKVSLEGKSFNEANINIFATSLHGILDKNSIIVNTRDVRRGNSILSVEFRLEAGAPFENLF